MNAIFDINRFLSLEKRNMFLSKMHYVYILGGLAALYLLSMLMKVWTGSSLSALVYIAVFLVIVAGPCFFEKSRNKHASIFDFILPASTFEKFLSIWLKYVIFIPVLIYLLILLLNLLTGLIPVDAIQQHAESMTIDGNILSRRAIFLIYATQATFLGGYFYFKKYAFAKTAVLIMIVSIFLMCIGIVIGSYFLSGETLVLSAGAGQEIESYNLGYNLGAQMGSIMENSLIKTMDTIIDIIFILGMWIVCFFKLRETEI